MYFTSAGSNPALRRAGTHACSSVISGKYTSAVPPQWPCGSVAHCGALPPSMTTLPFGWVMRNHGTGISYSSPIPWFILMFSTWHFSVPHSNMYRRTSSAIGSLLSPVGHGRVQDVGDVLLRDLARCAHEQPLLLHR